jgi:hypothetical protein
MRPVSEKSHTISFLSNIITYLINKLFMAREFAAEISFNLILCDYLITFYERNHLHSRKYILSRVLLTRRRLDWRLDLLTSYRS